MSTKHFIRNLGLVSALSSAALLGACGGGGGSGGIAGSDTGTLAVSMTDAPACGFDKVNVTVSKVRVNKSATAGDTDSGWTDITLASPKKIDLLSLQNGILTTLGQTTLSAGHYTQMRLVLADNASTPLANSVVATGSTTETAIETPSAIQSGIKLTNEFDVAANATTDLVLDFDACKSIVTKGNGGGYLLKPVISVTPKIVSGGITGYVTPGLAKATVTAQQNGVVIKSTVPDSTGAFTLSPVATSATPYVVVVTSDAHATAAITGVQVAASGSTQLSTSAAPIAPPASAMGTISGTVSPATALANVRALQTLGTSTVEVGFMAANSTTGAYSLSLPVGAISLSAYSATLPLTFSTTTTLTTAGKYTVEASATGYTKQTADVDISGTNATKNFTLVP
jgi:hypothetical protein